MLNGFYFKPKQPLLELLSSHCCENWRLSKVNDCCCLAFTLIHIFYLFTLPLKPMNLFISSVKMLFKFIFKYFFFVFAFGFNTVSIKFFIRNTYDCFHIDGFSNFYKDSINILRKFFPYNLFLYCHFWLSSKLYNFFLFFRSRVACSLKQNLRFYLHLQFLKCPFDYNLYHSHFQLTSCLFLCTLFSLIISLLRNSLSWTRCFTFDHQISIQRVHYNFFFLIYSLSLVAPRRNGGNKSLLYGKKKKERKKRKKKRNKTISSIFYCQYRGDFKIMSRYESFRLVRVRVFAVYNQFQSLSLPKI